jgi:hypothetical protein
MRIHHLAILTTDPPRLAKDHVDLLGVSVLREHVDDQGVRAVWIDLGGAILMIERGAADGARGAGRGLDGLFLAVEPGTGPAWMTRLGARVTGRTPYTIYATDIDGNRIGVSSYPEPLG